MGMEFMADMERGGRRPMAAEGMRRGKAEKKATPGRNSWRARGRADLACFLRKPRLLEAVNHVMMLALVVQQVLQLLAALLRRRNAQVRDCGREIQTFLERQNDNTKMKVLHPSHHLTHHALTCTHTVHSHTPSPPFVCPFASPFLPLCLPSSLSLSLSLPPLCVSLCGESG